MHYSEGIWNLCFRQIMDCHKKSSYSLWTIRIKTIVTSWNLQHHQENAGIEKQLRYRKKRTAWSQILREIQKRLLKQQLSGWNKRFDRLRSNWQDRGERVKGGLFNMEKRKTERIGMKDLREMLEKQDYKCALTGRRLSPDNCMMDHIIPLAIGGHHTKSNAQLVCSEANKAKGQMSEEDFIQLCKEVVNNNSGSL